MAESLRDLPNAVPSVRWPKRACYQIQSGCRIDGERGNMLTGRTNSTCSGPWIAVDRPQWASSLDRALAFSIGMYLRVVAFRFEVDLREPVATWLRDAGFDVRIEVPILGRRADLVGSRGTSVTAIEMKMHRWAEALRQAIAYQLAADRVWVAMPLDAAAAPIANVGPSNRKASGSSRSTTGGAFALPSSRPLPQGSCRSCGRRSSRVVVPMPFSCIPRMRLGLALGLG